MLATWFSALLLSSPVSSALGVVAPSCAKVEHGVCLEAAKPILRIIKGTHDPAACCAQCLNLTACVAWNVNSAMDQCFLRAVAGPANPGSQCISGQTGRKG